MKGLEKLKKSELIDIVLRKDDVDKAKNVRIDELGTKLSASEKLIEELRCKADKFKSDKDSINHRLSEANSTIISLKRDRDALINKNLKLEDKLVELNKSVYELENKGKVGKVMGIAGCVLIAVAVAILLIF